MPLTSPLVMIDDSDDDLALARTLLAKSGEPRPIVGLRTDDAAIEYLATLATAVPLALPAMAIVDATMPRLNGFELLEWIREHAVFDPMAVVMWSTADDPVDIARAARLGAQGYFLKYPSVGVLRELLAAGERFASAPHRSAFRIAGNLMLGRNGLPDLTAP